MTDPRESGGQSPGFKDIGLADTPESMDPLSRWRESLNLPQHISFEGVPINDWGTDAKTGAVLLLGPAAMAGIGIAAAKFISESPEVAAAHTDEELGSDKNTITVGPSLSRRQFLHIFGVGGAGALIAACVPGSSSPKPQERGQSSGSPTPTIDIDARLVASLRTDSSYVDERTWAEKALGPQILALRNQYDSKRINSMRMGVQEVAGRNGAYLFNVTDGTNKLLYVGADGEGRGGIFITVPARASMVARESGVVVGFAINNKADRLEFKYIDPLDKDYLDPRFGMMVGVGSGVPAELVSIGVNSFLDIESTTLSNFVKDRIIGDKDQNAEFNLKVKYDSETKQVYGIFEHLNSKGESAIYIITKSAGIHKLQDTSGYVYRLNEAGDIDLYKSDQYAGRVTQVRSTGEVKVEIPGISSPTPNPLDNILPTATATVNLSPSPTATAAPTETPTAIPTPDYPPLPDLNKSTQDYTWQMDLNNLGSPMAPKTNVSTSDASLTVINNDPTGFGFDKIIETKILSPTPANGGLLSDGVHRGYVAPVDRYFGGRCRGEPIVFEAYIYVKDVDPNINIGSGRWLTALAGDALTDGNKAYFNTKMILTKDNSGEKAFVIIPFSFPKGSNTAVDGKITTSATFPFDKWVAARSIVTKDAAWVQMGMVGPDKKVVEWVTTGYVPNQQANQSPEDRQVCNINFGPYAGGNVSLAHILQTKNSVTFYGSSLKVNK